MSGYSTCKDDQLTAGMLALVGLGVLMDHAIAAQLNLFNRCEKCNGKPPS